MDGGKKQAVRSLCLTNFLYWLGVYLYVPVLPVYLARQGFDSQAVGWIVGSFSLGAVLCRLPGGAAADRYGTTLVALTGLAVASGSLAGYWLGGSLGLLLLLRLLHGVGSSLYSSAAVTMVTLVSPAGQTKEAVAWYTLCSMLGIGVATSGGRWLLDTGGFAAVLLLSAAVTVPCLFVLPRGVKAAGRGGALPLYRLLRQPGVYLPTLVQLAVYIDYGVCMTFLPLWLQHTGAETAPEWFYVSYTVAVIAARFGGARLQRWLPEAQAIPGILVLLGAALVLPFVSHAWWALLGLGLLLGGGVGAALPLLVNRLTQTVDNGQRGAALGFFSTAIDLGMGIGSAALGLLIGPLGYPGAFAAALLWTAATWAIYCCGERPNLVVVTENKA